MAIYACTLHHIALSFAKATAQAWKTLPLEIQNNHYEQTNGGGIGSFELTVMERRHIARMLEYTKGNKTETARLLKIGLTTLYRKIEEYGIK